MGVLVANYQAPSNIGDRGWGTTGDSTFFDPLISDPTQSLPYDSPEFWLDLGIQEISAKLPFLQECWNMHSGKHPLPNGDPRYEKALADLQKKVTTNYIELVNKAPIQRMQIKYVRFGDEQKADPSARKMLRKSEADSQIDTLLLKGAIFGEMYARVLVPDDDLEPGELPPFVVKDPRACHVFPDPQNPLESLAGVELWKDYYRQRVLAVVFMKDAIYAYEGPESTSGDIAGLTHSSFTLTDVDENPSGKVALVRGEWTPGGRPETIGVWPVQHRISYEILNRLVISKSQAYRQRVLTGVSTKSRDKKNKSAPSFDPGASALWVVENEAAKAQEFSPIDNTGILAAIRDDVIDMCTLTQTSSFYLMGKISNVGGDTLSQADAGFVSKVRQRCRSAGWMIEQIIRVGFLMVGDTQKGIKDDAEVVWADPEVRNRAENADAALKEAQVFSQAPPWAIRVLGERMGLDADQIEELAESAEKWAKEQQEREDAVMDKQTQGQIAVNAAKPTPQSTGGRAPSNSS